MALQDGPLPRVIVPEKPFRSQFLDSQDSVDGRQLGKLLDTRIPVYEQERFERRIFYFHEGVIGNGSVAQIQFLPPDGFGAWRLLRMFADFATTAQEGLEVKRRWFEGIGGAQRDEIISSVLAAAAGVCPLVQSTATCMINSTNQNSSYVSGPVDFYPRAPWNTSQDQLIIDTTSALPVAETIDVMGVIEKIPTPGEMGTISNLFSNTP